jgi:hypothetical protein
LDSDTAPLLSLSNGCFGSSRLKNGALGMSFLANLKKQSVIVAAVALWIPAVAFGINVLWKYSTTPGAPATPPPNWPVNVSIQRDKGKATLLMFAHPQCPCTSATLGELAIIMAHAQGRLDADVFFYLPPGESSAWARGNLWSNAIAIPGVRVFEDRGAAVAQSFGSHTSGQTLLYDSRGRLVFKGGITAFRGHSGDNAGRTAITTLLQNEAPGQSTPPVVTTPVLGCSLRGE